MAHIDDHARIVWLCLPHFDSSFVFGSLLDPERGGHMSVEGHTETRVTHQYYIRNTNVLTTEVETAEGVFRVTDCAPRFVQYDRYFKPLLLIRKIEPLGGNPRVRVVCRPRGDYGRVAPSAYLQSNHIRYDIGEERLRLNANIPLSYIAGEMPFVLSEAKYVVLTWGVPFEAPLESTAEDYLNRTIHYWEQWVQRCAISRFYQKEVIRSALVLKLHQFEDTGAIVAAGTTSLPEHPQSGRNWDYRFCWLRDAYYTLNALSRVGQFDEMQRFAHFIENIAAALEEQPYPPVVRIDGTTSIPERVLDLAGYDGHGMVRIGNDAFRHVQNDVYGQVIYALLSLYIDERFPRQLRDTSKRLIMTLLGKINATLDEPDNTLWELRERKINHCYTALFHWVGSKAAVKIADTLGDREMRRLATRLVARSASAVERCYDPDLGAYTQSAGSKSMDASLLHLVTLHFLDPGSPRAASHMAAIESELGERDGLLFRYKTPDDFGMPKTAFLVCGFWQVEALAVMGQIDEALSRLDRLLGFANHLGLLSEDVDPSDGSQWGNFPQTYSHVGLMNAVFRLTSRIDYPEFF